MEGKVQVTVVATGFEDPAVIKMTPGKGAKGGKASDGRSDFLFGDEWESLRGGGEKQPPPFRGDDLEVPTVMRYGNVSAFENYGKFKQGGAG
jgi:hypothetical protein